MVREGKAAGIRTWIVVGAIVVLAVVARLPFLSRTFTPDEGGFLMVAENWAPGSSLYGEYWVDRPPLLVGIFGLANLIGGTPEALRVLGMVWVAVSTLLSAEVARIGAPESRFAPVAAALTCAVFLNTPYFGAGTVNGELLGLPFVLAGLIAVLRAWGYGEPPEADRPQRRLLWWAVAGVFGVAAMAVKQNLADVFVLIGVSVAVLLWRSQVRHAVNVVAAAGAAALGALGVLLAWAMSKGTSPQALWDAVVVFRIQASSVISESAPETNPDRAVEMVLAFVFSGALVLLMSALWVTVRTRGPRNDPERLPLGRLAVPLVVWEFFGIAAGGSYWLHYLVGLIPGLLLTTTWVLARSCRRHVVLPLAYSLFAAILATEALLPMGRSLASDDRVSRYLSASAQPGDTAVTAFGNPAILRQAGLSSPYEYLWSLPVRVRDPELTQFTELLASESAPVWVVVAGESVGTWGVDAAAADEVLERRYRQVAEFGDWHVFRLTSAPA